MGVLGVFTDMCLTLFFRSEELYLPFGLGAVGEWVFSNFTII
jgi:hypothetical protein